MSTWGTLEKTATFTYATTSRYRVVMSIPCPPEVHERRWLARPLSVWVEPSVSCGWWHWECRLSSVRPPSESQSVRESHYWRPHHPTAYPLLSIKDMFWYSTVSSPPDHSKHFTFHTYSTFPRTFDDKISVYSRPGILIIKLQYFTRFAGCVQTLESWKWTRRMTWSSTFLIMHFSFDKWSVSQCS